MTNVVLAPGADLAHKRPKPFMRRGVSYIFFLNGVFIKDDIFLTILFSFLRINLSFGDIEEILGDQPWFS